MLQSSNLFGFARISAQDMGKTKIGAAQSVSPAQVFSHPDYLLPSLLRSHGKQHRQVQASRDKGF
jgi:hypothetical protein